MDRLPDAPGEAPVPPALAPYVVSTVGFSAHGLTPAVHRGLPSPWLTLVVSVGRPLRTAPSEEAWAAGVRDPQWVVLGGLHTRAAMVEQAGSWEGVQLALHPLGVRRLLGVPAAALPTDRWDARDLLGGEVDRVVEELHAAPTWEHRYAAVHGMLLRRAGHHGRRDQVRPEVDEAWRLLTRTSEPESVAGAADRVGYSRRRLGQLFADEVGHGPKTIGRLARFDHARRRLGRHSPGGPLDLTGLAVRCGYYDQSHLVRDFREFAGLPPSEWLAAEFPNVQAGAARAAAG